MSTLQEQGVIYSNYWITEVWGQEKAAEIQTKIFLELQKIAEMPEMYPMAPGQKSFRKFVFSKQTSVYYRVKPATIEIIAIWGNREDSTNRRI